MNDNILRLMEMGMENFAISPKDLEDASSEVMHWNIYSASLYLNEKGIRYRVSNVNGKGLIVIHNFDPTRLNLELNEEERIINVYRG
jgi:hypothetical protein